MAQGLMLLLAFLLSQFIMLQNMFDNMSGFWRMQCADEDFKITPKNYSLYLDPQQREKDLKITWNTYVSAKEKCIKWLYDYSEHFNSH